MIWELWEHPGGQTFLLRDADVARHQRNLDQLLREEPQAARA